MEIISSLSQRYLGIHQSPPTTGLGPRHAQFLDSGFEGFRVYICKQQESVSLEAEGVFGHGGKDERRRDCSTITVGDKVETEISCYSSVSMHPLYKLFQKGTH